MNESHERQDTAPLKISDRQTGIFMTNSNDKGSELLRQERRRRWSTDQKLTMVRESLERGQRMSVAAPRNGINANQLFLWRKLYHDGTVSAVSADEPVVPAPELTDALKQIRELHRMLSKTNDGIGDPQRGRRDRPVAKMDCAVLVAVTYMLDSGHG